MASKMIAYKKRKVSVVDVHGRKHLFIDGEHIPVTAIAKSGRYWSIHLPYKQFSNLHDLGKAIVDYRAMDEKKR